jgi:hypothetical protein
MLQIMEKKAVQLGELLRLLVSESMKLSTQLRKFAFPEKRWLLTPNMMKKNLILHGMWIEMDDLCLRLISTWVLNRQGQSGSSQRLMTKQKLKISMTISLLLRFLYHQKVPRGR